MLTRLVEISYPALCPEVRRRFGDLESHLLRESQKIEQRVQSERSDQTRTEVLGGFTAGCCEQSADLARVLTDALAAEVESLREVSDHRSDFLRKAAEDAGMELPTCLT